MSKPSLSACRLVYMFCRAPLKVMFHIKQQTLVSLPEATGMYRVHWANCPVGNGDGFHCWVTIPDPYHLLATAHVAQPGWKPCYYAAKIARMANGCKWMSIPFP